MDALMQSLTKWGQCVPILVDQTYTLCDGGRRLTAIKQLGWPHVLTTVQEMTEDERAALEMELDEQHKPLTAYERSKGVVRRAREFSEAAALSTTLVDKPKARGHEAEYGVPKEEVAKAIGVSASNIRRAEQHVEAVDEFPDLADAPQKKAIREAEKRRSGPDIGKEWAKKDVINVAAFVHDGPRSASAILCHTPRRFVDTPTSRCTPRCGVWGLSTGDTPLIGTGACSGLDIGEMFDGFDSSTDTPALSNRCSFCCAVCKITWSS